MLTFSNRKFRVNLRYSEGSESFSFILCLIMRIDIQELKISYLLLSHNRTGIGNLINEREPCLPMEYTLEDLPRAAGKVMMYQ